MSCNVRLILYGLGILWSLTLASAAVSSQCGVWSPQTLTLWAGDSFLPQETKTSGHGLHDGPYRKASSSNRQAVGMEE